MARLAKIHSKKIVTELTNISTSNRLGAGDITPVVARMKYSKMTNDSH